MGRDERRSAIGLDHAAERGVFRAVSGAVSASATRRSDSAADAEATPVPAQLAQRRTAPIWALNTMPLPPSQSSQTRGAIAWQILRRRRCIMASFVLNLLDIIHDRSFCIHGILAP